MHELIRWILREGPGLEQEPLINGLAQRLREHAPVSRLFTATLALHPTSHGLGVVWREDGPTQTMVEGWDIRRLPGHYDSPISFVMDEGKEYRARLDGGPYDYSLLAQFEAEGLTDWIGLPLDLGEWVSVFALSSRAPGGFSDEDVAFLRDVGVALSPVLRVLALRRTASGILDTYLGPHAGQRVWSGKIRQGDGEDIHAVIWFCDLRHSTPLADRLPRPVFLALLDQFFGAMAGSIQDAGGEVLRYIGDAVLAIFPIEDPGDRQRAVEAAVTAARNACARMDALNAERAERSEEPLGFGIGLHLGHVMYGNIGTPTRLEFSVIGAAANEAARVEGMCKELGRDVIVSAAVATHVPGEVEALGSFELRGVSREIELFGVNWRD